MKENFNNHFSGLTDGKWNQDHSGPPIRTYRKLTLYHSKSNVTCLYCLYTYGRNP